MTAAELATATDIGRGTVSTMLSRLAKAGEITKAARGYQLNHRRPRRTEQRRGEHRRTERR